MIKCIAIDDEPIALSIIEEYCRRFGGIELHSFTSPVAGMAAVDSIRPDIVFLDIEMNSHNGLELARSLPDGICRIFTTAFSQYALDGFEADAVDFLHKPIFYPRFERAIEKAMKWIGRQPVESSSMPKDILTLKVEHKNVVLDTGEIIYIEAMDNYVKVFRRNRPMVMSQITMKEMETLLPHGRFIRVHRSFIVALGAIDRFSNRQIFIHGLDRHIPVGRKYVESFNNLYKIFKSAIN
ncbi:MAG: LytTR family DNA-binding domain-containing protein [Muribaculaceae bacterium]|nr:LytTR family DNA-binding domain-containing protein [Muribaculaceae bacterium]